MTLRTPARITPYLLAGLVLAFAIPAHAQQTNDPLVGQQQYLFDVHKVDEAWSVTKGSSNTLVALHSVLGFRRTHEDLSGRTLSPRGAAIRPEFGFATAMAGVAAANTNNGIGIVGIDRQAKLRSYSVLRNTQTGDDPNNIVEFTNDSGGTERFYLDLDTFSQRVNEARSDGADVHLFEYGLPTGAANGAPFTQINPQSLAFAYPNFPSLPPGQQAVFAGELRSTGNTILSAFCWGSGCSSPPNPLSLLRDAVINAVIEDDAVIVAPAGDAVDGQVPLEGYAPSRVGKYSVGVGGVVDDPTSSNPQ